MLQQRGEIGSGSMYSIVIGRARRSLLWLGFSLILNTSSSWQKNFARIQILLVEGQPNDGYVETIQVLPR